MPPTPPRTPRRTCATIDVPAIPRLLADDATPEAVASLLAEHDGRIAIVSRRGRNLRHHRRPLRPHRQPRRVPQRPLR